MPRSGAGYPVGVHALVMFPFLQSATHVVICWMSSRDKTIARIRQVPYAIACMAILPRLCPRKRTSGATEKDNTIKMSPRVRGMPKRKSLVPYTSRAAIKNKKL